MTQTPQTPPATHRRASIAILLWLAMAGAIGATGVLPRLPRPAIQGIIAALTVICLLCWRRWPAARSLATHLAPSTIVLFHLPRLLIGATFLALLNQGQLPRGFALPAGIGDIMVGSLGAAVLLTRTRRTPLWWWNLLGLADITGVVISAARAGLNDPASMAPLARLPLSLLPTWYVPLVITTHVVLFSRLRAAANDEVNIAPSR